MNLFSAYVPLSVSMQVPNTSVLFKFNYEGFLYLHYIMFSVDEIILKSILGRKYFIMFINLDEVYFSDVLKYSSTNNIVYS